MGRRSRASPPTQVESSLAQRRMPTKLAKLVFVPQETSVASLTHRSDPGIDSLRSRRIAPIRGNPSLMKLGSPLHLQLDSQAPLNNESQIEYERRLLGLEPSLEDLSRAEMEAKAAGFDSLEEQRQVMGARTHRPRRDRPIGFVGWRVHMACEQDVMNETVREQERLLNMEGTFSFSPAQPRAIQVESILSERQTLKLRPNRVRFGMPWTATRYQIVPREGPLPPLAQRQLHTKEGPRRLAVMDFSSSFHPSSVDAQLSLTVGAGARTIGSPNGSVLRIPAASNREPLDEAELQAKAKERAKREKAIRQEALERRVVSDRKKKAAEEAEKRRHQEALEKMREAKACARLGMY